MWGCWPSCSPGRATWPPDLKRLELRLPPVVLVALVAAVMWWAARITVSFDAMPLVRGAFALLLVIKGGWIAAAGVMAFRSADTTVNPMTPEASSRVVQHGIYRHTRNPMYLGFLFVLIAWAVWLAAPWALLGPALYVAWMTRFQIVPEERALAGRFGDEFRDYCRRTRRWV